MKFKGTIESVELKKQGETNGRAWSIYEMFVSGKKFSTFDAEYQNHVGEEVEFEYEERESNGFTNLTAKDMDWKPSKTDLLEARVAAIEKQLGIRAGTAVNEASAPKAKDEIDISDIPM